MSILLLATRINGAVSGSTISGSARGCHDALWSLVALIKNRLLSDMNEKPYPTTKSIEVITVINCSFVKEEVRWNDPLSPDSANTKRLCNTALAPYF